MRYHWFPVLAVIVVTGFIATSANADVILSDLIALYDFNGSAADSSGNGYDAGFVGGAVISGDSLGYSSSAGDHSLDVGSGTTEYANVTGAAKLSDATTANKVAVSYWMYNTGNGSGGNVNNSAFRVVSTTGGGRGVQAHSPWSDGTFYFDHAGCCGAGNRLTASVGTSLIDDWHHIVLQVDNGSKEIWVDGTLESSQATGASAVPTFTNQILIGADLDGGGNWFRGRIDEFAVWSNTLSQSQIQSLAGGTSTADLFGIDPPSEPVQILGVTATASSELTTGSFNRVVGNIVDNVGLDTIVPDGNPGEANGMWLNNGTFATPNDLAPEVTFDLGSIEKIDEMRVFNYNEATSGLFTRGVNELEILVSNDNFSVDTRSLGLFNFDIATGAAGLTGQSIDLGVEAQFVKFDILSNHGDGNNFVGLNEVQFFTAMQQQVVPEPSTLALATLGLLGLRFGRRWRKRTA